MRVFCFDLDDTLVSERAYVESGLREVGDRLDARAGRAGGGSGEWLVEEWRRSRAPDLFQRRLALLGLDPAWLPDLVRAYRTHAPRLEVREGALEVLEALVRRGDRLALVSDGHLASQQAKWRALRLELPFDPVIFTDVRGRAHWKPHPWAFERVAGSAPGAAGLVYVADNAEKDFEAPNRLGWLTVRLRHPDNLRPWAEAEGDARPAVEAERFAALLELP